MKKVLLFVFILFVVSCVPVEEVVEEIEEVEEVEVVEEEIEIIEPEPISLDVPCTNNSECLATELCLDNICARLADLYSGDDCEIKCKLDEVTFTTSDGQEFTTPPGRGSYTGAGAMDWIVQRTPPHCEGEDVKVPILFTKKSYSTVYAEEAIVLEKGETSKVITHPLVKSINFQLTVDDVRIECS
ncbi:MAG: hypothetical protein CMH61_00710 [Nanoarchaeota archaeon]|nr:hypothetical protein [Nanoarchaeota archaeon]|tara:strand:+ start:3342 stop:3899 length:558 start_codon:yes stop_codon:yes gene_type:complete